MCGALFLSLCVCLCVCLAHSGFLESNQNWTVFVGDDLETEISNFTLSAAIESLGFDSQKRIESRRSYNKLICIDEFPKMWKNSGYN